MVERWDVVSEEVIHHLLHLGAYIHVCLHIYLLHLEAGILQHLLYSNDISMSCAPCQLSHTTIDIVAAATCYLKDRSHIETRSGMRVILYDDIFLIVLDTGTYLSQCLWASDASHILETYLVSPGIDKGLCEVDVILYGMYWRMSDAQCCLCYHTSLMSIFYRRNNIAWVVKSAEDTCDISTLRLLNLIEQLSEVFWARTHTQAVQGTVEHVGLDACLMERLCPLANTFVGILTIKEVYLFEAATIGLDSVETSHTDDSRSYFY